MAHANLSSFFDDAMPDGNERTCWNDFADDNDIEHNYPMEIDWLTSKRKWPESVERKVENYMVDHDFYHYQKTKDDSKQHLNVIMDELRMLFDPKKWDEGIHTRLLKEKVLNKIPRIRDKRNPLARLKKVFQRLHSDHYEDALEFMAATIGEDRARSILDSLRHDQSHED